MADFNFNTPTYKTPRKYKNFVDLTGLKFERLAVLGYVGRDAQNCGIWHCRCDCGTERIVRTASLRFGITLSCGCLNKEIVSATFTTHGHSYDKEYKVYHAAKLRCQNPRDKTFYRYGGRGIQFNFVSFEEFITELGPKPTPEHSVDRIDNNGHYEIGNVRWATAKEQANNTRRNQSKCPV